MSDAGFLVVQSGLGSPFACLELHGEAEASTTERCSRLLGCCGGRMLHGRFLHRYSRSIQDWRWFSWFESWSLYRTAIGKTQEMFKPAAAGRLAHRAKGISSLGVIIADLRALGENNIGLDLTRYWKERLLPLKSICPHLLSSSHSRN